MDNKSDSKDPFDSDFDAMPNQDDDDDLLIQNDDLQEQLRSQYDISQNDEVEED